MKIFAVLCLMLFAGRRVSAQPELSYQDLYTIMVDHGYDNVFQKTYAYESDGRLGGDSTAFLYTTLKYTRLFYLRDYALKKYSTERLEYLRKHLNVWRQPDSICREMNPFPWPCGEGYRMDSFHRWIIYTSGYKGHNANGQSLDSSITLYDQSERLVSTATYSTRTSGNGQNIKQRFWMDSAQYNDLNQRYRQVFEHYDPDGILTYREEYLNTFDAEGLLQMTICSKYSLKNRDTTVEKTYYTFQHCPHKIKKKKWRPYYDG